jgi:hypothetical protein
MHPALQLVVNFQEERRGWSSSAPCVFWQGEFRIIEPKFPVRQFLDFRFGVNASHFFHLPHPIQTLHNLRDPPCPSRNSCSN